MNKYSVQSVGGGARVCIPVRIGDRDVFRHDATPVLLQFLADNPGMSFTNRELHRLTGKGMGNVNAAVHSLEALGVITVDRDGRSNAVQINPATLMQSDDRITTIPQAEYHAPVREIRERIRAELGSDAGIVLFGSVAQGTADRASDIDVLVVVPEGRMDAQRTAHGIEDRLSSKRFDGDRYEPHIVVETQATAPRHDRIQDILANGITIHETDTLATIKDEVVSNGT